MLLWIMIPFAPCKKLIVTSDFLSHGALKNMNPRIFPFLLSKNYNSNIVKI